jgi:hypothetical protein
MKQLITLISIVIALVSCSEDRSGNRVPRRKIARVTVLKDNTVNWVQLNVVEAQVYQVGDTLKMTQDHLINDTDDEGDNSIRVRLDSIVNK